MWKNTDKPLSAFLSSWMFVHTGETAECDMLVRHATIEALRHLTTHVSLGHPIPAHLTVEVEQQLRDIRVKLIPTYPEENDGQ